jgi:hypothetical protein
MISRLRSAAVVFCVMCIAGVCAGCVVWHTQKVVLIEPTYSHLRDGPAGGDDAASTDGSVETGGEQAAP